MNPSRAMQARDLRRSIARLAHEISERMGPPDTYALAGIITGGATLCELCRCHRTNRGHPAADRLPRHHAVQR